jgi:Valyl-tRNA synthetase
MTDIADRYDPGRVESHWYRVWEERGLFHADAASPKKPYCIVIPPPNVTGSLHWGHALNNTLQDILIRYKRMDGYNALWVPGTDHASIAVHVILERQLAAEGKTRQTSAARPSSRWRGSGRRNRAATSSASSNAWALPATGRGSASPWTRG